MFSIANIADILCEAIHNFSRGRIFCIFVFAIIKQYTLAFSGGSIERSETASRIFQEIFEK